MWLLATLRGATLLAAYALAAQACSSFVYRCNTTGTPRQLRLQLGGPQSSALTSAKAVARGGGLAARTPRPRGPSTRECASPDLFAGEVPISGHTFDHGMDLRQSLVTLPAGYEFVGERAPHRSAPSLLCMPSPCMTA